MSDCLETYYKCLALSFDAHILVRDVMQLFYSLYDEYTLNINFEQDTLSIQAQTNRIGKSYK